MTKHITTRSMASAAALTASICAGAFVSGTAQAAEAAKGWEAEASAGATLTSGNSKTFLGTIGVNAAKRWSQEEILVGASAGYGKNSKIEGQQTTDQYVKAYGQWNHLFSEKFYGGVRADGLYDKIADVDYRLTISPLAGYYLIKNSTTKLAVEAGPAVVFERIGDTDRKYAGVRLGERFEHKFSNGAKVWQSVDWTEELIDFDDTGNHNYDNWVINAEVGISAPVTKSLDVRLVAQDTFRRLPAPGRQQNDLRLIAGVGYRF